MTKDNVKDMPWGIEITWAENEYYSSKFLIFDKKNAVTDMHFYNLSRRSWFVNLGKLKVHWIDTNTGMYKESILEEGATFEVNPNQPVQLKCLTDSANVTEVSNNLNGNNIFILSKGKTNA
jgi:hypothetical protein